VAQALYRKWRPQNFDDVVGQEHVTTTLRNQIATGRVGHAYLFVGSRGCGKTTSARIFAKEINIAGMDANEARTQQIAKAIEEGRSLDLIEIDAASNNSVDDVREIRDKVGFQPSELKYKVYVIDECFRYDDLVTLADGSKLPIGKIVEEKLNIEVLSYNEATQNIEPKQIVRHMRKEPVAPTLKITFDNNRHVVCTINHKFYTPDGQICAGHLQVGQFVYSSYERLTELQLEAITGAAIGDGHLAMNGSGVRARLSITQGLKQKEYLDYKRQLLGDCVRSEPQFHHSLKSFSKVGTLRLATLSYPQIAQLHRELYCREGQKAITPEFLRKVTPLGLALWYLDDGSLVTQANKHQRKDGTWTQYPNTRSTLSIYSFTAQEAQHIVNWLYEEWQIQAGVSQTAKGPAIWLTLEGTARLHQLIARYVPPPMQYKLLPEFRGLFQQPNESGKSSGLAVSVVKKIEGIEQPDWVYNIEVADNHNYFVRDILVANCHMLSVSAFNALLKTLEEPPAHVIFILATTDPQKIPATVLSRCQRFNFKRVPVDKIVARLHTLCEGESIEADEQALRLIARYASGALRDAVSLLDQLASSNSLRITASDVREALGATDASTVKALVDGLINKDPSAGFEAIQTAIDQGADARQVAKQMVDYLRALMQVKASASHGKLISSGDLSEAEKLEMSQHAEKVSLGLLSKATRAFSTAINDMRSTTDAQLPLEMAYLDCVVVAEGDGGDAAAIGQPRSQETRLSEDSRGVRMVERGVPAQPMAQKPVRPPEPAQAPSSQPAQPAAQPAGAAEPQKNVVANGTNGRAAFEQLNTGWVQFMKEVKAVSSPVHSVLTYCKLFDVQGELVILKADHDMWRTRLDNEKNKAIVITALNKFLSGKYGLKVFVGQLPIEPEEDPVLKAAKRLGGTIRE
jgi:DNA polymerase-3 subunit gamma/tau